MTTRVKSPTRPKTPPRVVRTVVAAPKPKAAPKPRTKAAKPAPPKLKPNASPSPGRSPGRSPSPKPSPKPGPKPGPKAGPKPRASTPRPVVRPQPRAHSQPKPKPKPRPKPKPQTARATSPNRALSPTKPAATLGGRAGGLLPPSPASSTPSKPFACSCNGCQDRFATQAALIAHLKQVHKVGAATKPRCATLLFNVPAAVFAFYSDEAPAEVRGRGTARFSSAGGTVGMGGRAMTDPAHHRFTVLASQHAAHYPQAPGGRLQYGTALGGIHGVAASAGPSRRPALPPPPPPSSLGLSHFGAGGANRNSAPNWWASGR
jgi:hypothetical protein